MNTETIILSHMWKVQEGQNLLVKRTWTDGFNYAEVEVSKEQHFFFLANGLHLRLSVGEHGFNLWDNDNGQWILDASVVGYLAHFAIGHNDVLKGVVLEKEKPSVGEVQYNIRPKTVIEPLPDDDLFCSEHQCEKNLVDYPDGSRYECPECQREDGEAMGRV